MWDFTVLILPEVEGDKGRGRERKVRNGEGRRGGVDRRRDGEETREGGK